MNVYLGTMTTANTSGIIRGKLYRAWLIRSSRAALLSGRLALQERESVCAHIKRYRWMQIYIYIYMDSHVHIPQLMDKSCDCKRWRETRGTGTGVSTMLPGPRSVVVTGSNSLLFVKTNGYVVRRSLAFDSFLMH